MLSLKIVFMDVDGVLTDGTAIFLNGVSPKIWYVRDRLAIKMLKKAGGDGLRVVWISGRPCSELSERGRELGVDMVYQDIQDKFSVMSEELNNFGLTSEEAMYIGDDLVDLKCMENAGVSCAPADAAAEILDTADFVSDFSGGRGAVRQIIEVLLKCRGSWDTVVEGYREYGRL